MDACARAANTHIPHRMNDENDPLAATAPAPPKAAARAHNIDESRPQAGSSTTATTSDAWRLLFGFGRMLFSS